MDAHPGSMLKPDGFDAENVTPIWVLDWAFGQTSHDPNYFSGLPSWASNERFDIIAKVGGADVVIWGRMTNEEKQKAIRDVFADRFAMRYHAVTHEIPVYALMASKNGVKLTPSKGPPNVGFAVRPDQGWFGYTQTGIAAGNMTMAAFAQHLSELNLGRPVQDSTGLNGRYDLKLDFSANMDAASDRNASARDGLPDIFTAVQEQLGLKLSPTTGPVDTIVIDHIDRPSGN